MGSFLRIPGVRLVSHLLLVLAVWLVMTWIINSVDPLMYLNIALVGIGALIGSRFARLRISTLLKYVNAGLFYAATGRYGEAADLLSTARILMPWSWDAAAGLGALCNRLNRLDDAISFYEIALQLRPGNAQYLAMIEQIRARSASGSAGAGLTAPA